MAARHIGVYRRRYVRVIKIALAAHLFSFETESRIPKAEPGGHGGGGVVASASLKAPRVSCCLLDCARLPMRGEQIYNLWRYGVGDVNEISSSRRVYLSIAEAAAAC